MLFVVQTTNCIGSLTLAFSNGETRVVDTYISDVDAANSTFDNGAGTAAAASDTFYIMPRDGYITDFSIVTGLTDTTAGQLTSNGVPIGSTIRWANALNTLQNRPALRVPIRAGSAIRIIQRA